jgi:hypothetical protein
VVTPRGIDESGAAIQTNTTMKPILTSLSSLGLLTSMALAGSVIPNAMTPASSDGFADARRPISNPTLFDLALPTTNLHPLFLYHVLPDQIHAAGTKVPLGGDVELYALQFEYALSDRLSIVATKDGYVDINSDSTSVLSDQDGFANLGAGLKYAFILDPVSKTAVSGSATFELPTGNSDVFQGEGKGLVNLIGTGLKLVDEWQFAGAVGLQVPFSDQQSTEGWISTHVSYEVCSWFIPLVEMNWFHVIDSGNGAGNFGSQVGGAVPGVIEFEGGDLFNLGAANADENRDLVTVALGFRSRLSESVDIGVAYEVPLTDEEASLMEKRITLDLVWQF